MIVVNDYTKEDFTKLGEEIIENVKKTVEQNPQSYISSLYTIINYGNSINNMDSENLADDINTSNNFGDEEDILYEKDFVNSEIEYAINSLLTDYKADLELDENTNLEDYLTRDRIANQVSMFEENLEIIDGTTIRCNYHEKTFFTKININGESFVLENAETLYSEDGTLESAK